MFRVIKNRLYSQDARLPGSKFITPFSIFEPGVTYSVPLIDTLLQALFIGIGDCPSLVIDPETTR